MGGKTALNAKRHTVGMTPKTWEFGDALSPRGSNFFIA